MGYNNEENVSPHWGGFRTLWWIVAILLFLFLLITWLMGYGPGGKNCQVPVQTIEKIKEVEKIRTVIAPDTMAPLITLNDNSVMRLITGSKYTEPGARAVDGTDGILSVTTTGNVDTSKAGEYTVTYKVTDAAGNTTTEMRKVIVSDPADSTSPVITLLGQVDAKTLVGNSYTDPGATAEDAADGTIKVTSTGSVNTNKIGVYVIDYKATDSAGNTATAKRTVTVTKPADTNSPVISLNGQSLIYQTVGDTYSEQGATANDSVDGKVTVVTTGSVNVNKVGEYFITYTATDSSENQAVEKRKVIITEPDDTTAPIITINGRPVFNAIAGTGYTDAGATAKDNIDGDISVITTGTVDADTAGEYIVTYTATDSAGNSSSETRMVIISQPKVVVEKPVARLYFGNNRDDNPSDTDKSLDAVIAYMNSSDNSNATALVTGFHSPSGNADYNRGLANRRANTVVKMLKAAGIPSERISIQQPAVTEGTGAPSKARRVEVFVR